MPAEALEAIDNDVDFLLFKIMDLRAYAHAKEIYDTTPMDQRPKNSVMDVVGSIKIELVKERIAEHLRQEAEDTE